MMDGLRRLVFAALLALASSAAHGAGAYAMDTFVRSDIVTEPTPENFSVCHAGTCTLVTQTGLDAAQWSRITAVFEMPAHDAEEERARIAEAIARFETVVGAITGTSDGRAGNQHGERWAVDSFCFENGKPPVIVPLDLWKRGWRPAKPPAASSP